MLEAAASWSYQLLGFLAPPPAACKAGLAPAAPISSPCILLPILVLTAPRLHTPSPCLACLPQVDKIFKAAALAANSARIPLAKMAVEETRMGVVEDKVGCCCKGSVDRCCEFVLWAAAMSSCRRQSLREMVERRCPGLGRGRGRGVAAVTPLLLLAAAPPHCHTAALLQLHTCCRAALLLPLLCAGDQESLCL